jgi:hypothetical protein
MHIRNVIHRINTTHTFGGTKAWENKRSFPYKKILFEHKFIFSSRYREDNGLFERGEPIRKMPEARSVNLDSYVFAYLGNHEHYYSQSDGFNSPPFGIFFTNDLELLDNTSASKYDLASPRAKFDFDNMLYSSPIEAREDTLAKIQLEFSHDFFQYWICPNYEIKEFNDEDSWTWKTEFHYFEKVSILDIKAILWPVVMVASTIGGEGRNIVWKKDEEIERHRLVFQNDKNHSNIKVYPYIWDGLTSVERFSYASYIIAKYFFENLTMPDENYFSQMFHKKFSKID